MKSRYFGSNTTHSKHSRRIRNRRKLRTSVQTVLVKKTIQQHAAALKRNPTPAEKCLQRALKAQNITFTFQKEFEQYFIVDFFFRRPKSRYNLVVELDGSSHNGKQDKDAKRDLILNNKYKARVIRFKNIDAIAHPDTVVQKIIQALASLEWSTTTVYAEYEET